jgi:hypothetical protein
MNIKKLNFTLIIAFLPYILFGQNYLSKEREKEIKLSGKYYYGASYALNEDEAKQSAFDNLRTEIIKDSVNKSRTQNEILQAIDMGVHFDRLKQESMIAILAWIAKDSVFVTQKPVENTPPNPQLTPVPPIQPPIKETSSIKEFVVKKADNAQRFYRDEGCTNTDGVLVFYSTIPTLKIAIPNSPGRLNNEPVFDEENNCYILCVKPTEDIRGSLYSKYSIKITAPGYKTEEAFKVSEVQAGKAQYFTINPKKIDDNKKIYLGLGNGIVAGKTIGVYAGFRFGGSIGAGLEGGFGISGKFTHWSLGAKLFPLNTNKSEFVKGLCLSAHYGTVSFEKSHLSNPEDGRFEFYGNRQLKGFSSLIGYDNVINKKIHINIGFGFSYSEQKKIMPAWNIGIGFSILDIFKK